MTTEYWIIVALYLCSVLAVVALLVESWVNAATIRRLRKERNAAWEESRMLMGERDWAREGRYADIVAAKRELVDAIDRIAERYPGPATCEFRSAVEDIFRDRLGLPHTKSMGE